MSAVSAMATAVRGIVSMPMAMPAIMATMTATATVTMSVVGMAMFFVGMAVSAAMAVVSMSVFNRLHLGRTRSGFALQAPEGLYGRIKLANDLQLESCVANTHSLRHLNGSLQNARGIVWSVHHDVRGAQDRRGSKRPDMHIMDGVHMRDTYQFCHQLSLADVLRSSDHEGIHGKNYRGLGGAKDQDPEKKGAARIGVGPPTDLFTTGIRDCADQAFKRLLPDQQGCKANAKRLNNVTYDMCNSCLDCNASPTMGMSTVMSMVTMTVTVTKHLKEDDIHNESNDRNHKHL
mmetsp:Transcript_155763/g.283286  ORF Transcript_155763/g.283286 Transcript_155763/m.283286 type:complete len:290 (-) Transcript_155763:561-1430(-)